MRFISIDHVTENQILAESIVDNNFNILLKTDTILNDDRIKQLPKYGYKSIYIKDDIEYVPNSIIKHDERLQLLKHIKSTFSVFQKIHNTEDNSNNRSILKKLYKDRDSKIDILIEFADKILLGLKKYKVEFIETVDIKSELLYPYQHALNTALIASIIGLRLSLNYLELKTLFISSIFIEMGNLSIPPSILYKKGPLTSEEFEIMKSHTNISYQEVKSCDDLNRNVKLVCLQHHEKLNGTGYPMGIDSSDINILTRIVTISDAYDALTSDRSYRRAYAPKHALDIMKKEIDISYDNSIFSILESVMLPYPRGAIVKLNIGIATVQNYTKNPLKPIVKLASNSKLVDLSSISGVDIIGIFDESK